MMTTDSAAAATIRALEGARAAATPLGSTLGGAVDLSALPGLSVVYAYPMTSPPDGASPEGWDILPGARGCTPQSCAFRDHAAELRALGAAHLFGLSTQTTAYQREAAARLHLPFALLSDEGAVFAAAMGLPTFDIDGHAGQGGRLLRRLTMIIADGVVAKVFYPVDRPAENATDVAAWLDAQVRRGSPIR